MCQKVGKMLYQIDDESCLIEDAPRPLALPQGGEEIGPRCLVALVPLEGREDTKDRQREHGRGRRYCR